jgi:hypothetical protein
VEVTGMRGVGSLDEGSGDAQVGDRLVLRALGGVEFLIVEIKRLNNGLKSPPIWRREEDLSSSKVTCA